MTEEEKRNWQTTAGYYQQWNEAVFQSKIRNAGKKSVVQKWREFSNIMEFGLMIKPVASHSEQKKKVEMYERYYERMQKLSAIFEVEQKIKM